MDNLAPMFIEKLVSFSKEFPTYTARELLYSVLSNLENSKDLKPGEILKGTDEEIYSALEKAIKKERS